MSETASATELRRHPEQGWHWELQLLWLLEKCWGCTPPSLIHPSPLGIIPCKPGRNFLASPLQSIGGSLQECFHSLLAVSRWKPRELSQWQNLRFRSVICLSECIFIQRLSLIRDETSIFATQSSLGLKWNFVLSCCQGAAAPWAGRCLLLLNSFGCPGMEQGHRASQGWHRHTDTAPTGHWWHTHLGWHCSALQCQVSKRTPSPVWQFIPH